MVRRGFTSQFLYELLTSATGEHSSANSCSCGAGGACQCRTPRNAPRRRNTGERRSDEEYEKQMGPAEPKRNHKIPIRPSPLSSQVLARIAELRPVLPRPSNRSGYSTGAPQNPSSNAAQRHHMRHSPRDNVMFSPYGRAYDMSHSVEDTRARSNSSGQNSAQDIPHDIPNFHRSNIAGNQQSLVIPSSAEPWLSGESFPSPCNCGDGCTCPGCVEHNGGRALAPGTSAFSLCANPGACSYCLDCTILSLPPSLPPDAASSIYDSSQSQSIDEWIRQISAQSNSIPDSTPSGLPTDIGMAPGYAPPWDNVQMRLSAPIRKSLVDSCNGQSSGLCPCSGDCRGECTEHDDIGIRIGGVRFATSGERGSCCLAANGRAVRSLESFERGSRFDLSAGLSSARVNQGLLDIPDMSRSRSSSNSSQSVPESGYSSDLSTMFPTPRSNMSRGLPSSGSSSSTSSVDRRRVGASNVSSQPRTPDGSTGVTYAISNPDSEASSDDRQFDVYSQYNPSLDRMHL